MPRPVLELHRQREALRPQVEQPGESVVPLVGPGHLARHAIEDAAEPRPEAVERPGQPADALGLVVAEQRPHRAAALRLDREPERLGRPRQPTRDRAVRRLPIERVVELARAQALGVRPEQVLGAQPRRVERRRPGRVGEAARPDPERAAHDANPGPVSEPEDPPRVVAVDGPQDVVGQAEPVDLPAALAGDLVGQ